MSGCGKPAQVLLTIEGYRRLRNTGKSIASMLAKPDAEIVDFEPGRSELGELRIPKFQRRAGGHDQDVARESGFAIFHRPHPFSRPSRSAALCNAACSEPKSDRDSLIAATALAHCLTVVTRNTSDFEASTVRLLNPWLRQESSGIP
jgi:predicted nucleic acid-binding protein